MGKTEVIVIGAGPIGIEVASALKQLDIDYLHFDAGQIGSTIQKWPRNTRFFSAPERVAIAGVPVQTIEQEQLTGERYLAYLRGVVEIFDLDIQTYEKVVEISGNLGNFTVVTESRTGVCEYKASRIIIATGDMNDPAELGIPGEAMPHVTHYFDDPHTYFRSKVLVVGGRNSAVEAVLRCFRSGASVSVSYRKPAFDRAHVNSRLHLEIGILLRKGKIAFYPETIPSEIDRTTVLLRNAPGAPAGTFQVAADFVVLCTGFRIDQTLLRSIGAALDGDENIPVIDENTMETTVPGVYLAGTTVSGNRTSERQFIGTSHHHVAKAVRAVTGKIPPAINTIEARRYPFTRKDLEIDVEQKTY